MRQERADLVKAFSGDSDLRSKTLVQGIAKVCVLGMIKYHQIRQELFDEISLHPETLKGLEVLHYHVENNYPIEKELLYTLVPELYVHQINKLGAEDKKRFKNTYAFSKNICENICKYYALEFNMNICIIRLTTFMANIKKNN